MSLREPPAHRVAAQRWAITLVEPLCSPSQRNAIEEAFYETALDYTGWWAVYVSGVLADITGTLPGDDPIRQLELLPDGSADWVAPHPYKFGTWQSVTDVVEPSSDAPTLDPSYLALEDPLHPVATGLIRRSLDGWAAVHQAIEQRIQSEAINDLAQRRWPTGPTREIFDIATAAIRFAAHRRRSYGLPNDDVWPVVSGFTWTWRAQWVIDGRDIDEDQIALSIRQEQIQPGGPGQERFS